MSVGLAHEDSRYQELVAGEHLDPARLQDDDGCHGSESPFQPPHRFAQDLSRFRRLWVRREGRENSHRDEIDQHR